MSTITEKTIDLDDIVKGKMGSKAKYVPRPLMRWLKHIVHQDEVNEFLWEHRAQEGTAWLIECVKYLDMTLIIEGEENIPAADDGRLYTFVSNHPLGGIDGVALGTIIGKHYGDNYRYLVNDLLMNLPGLAPLCIPINKTGRNGRDFPAIVEAGFAGTTHLIMFPAGLCSRRQGGVIKDIAWKKTFVTKSVESRRDIVPIHFGGRNSDFFYRLANVCKLLHIKFNIAMLFLADEMYKNRHKSFTIKIGKPIPWQTFDRTKKPAEWAQYVQDIVYHL